MRKVSEKTKIKEGRGTGKGANYKSWIQNREMNSNGVECALVDWKHHRAVQLLSRGEKMAYLILRWDDSVMDIREQFPLNLDETCKIADEIGYKRPSQGRFHMTTDLLVEYADGTLKAFSVKTSSKEFTDNQRNMELAVIEYLYWNHHGVKWQFIESDKLNKVKSTNIENVVAYWDINDVVSEFDYVKHLIAHKKVIVDMENDISYKDVICKLKKEGIWDFQAVNTMD